MAVSSWFSDLSQSSDEKWASGSLSATRTTGGGVFAWQNPESTAVIIDRVIIDVTTAATSTVCTVDIGYTATSATTSDDDLLDGVAFTSAGVYDNTVNIGTNGKGVQKAAAGKWVTATEKTGDVTGLAGKFYLHYRRIRA